MNRASVTSGRWSKYFRGEELRSTLTAAHLIVPARFVDQSLRRIFETSVEFLRKLTRLPLLGTRLVPLLARIDTRDRLLLELDELIRVCSALDNAHVPYCVTGGWGIDAVVGVQTRRHCDLDIALDQYRENLESAAAVFQSLGYRRMRPLGGTVWFPDAEVFEDGRGHRIEVLSINWDLLAEARNLLLPLSSAQREPDETPSTPAPRLLELCATTASIGGVKIPALSAVAQRLFHQGYPPHQKNWQADEAIQLISASSHAQIPPLRDAAAKTGKEAHRPSTLLLVPVFEFPPEMWRLCSLYHHDLSIIPPHVTLAFPFLALEAVTTGVVEELTTLFNETPAFDFELHEIRWFGSDVVYLEPTKSDRFRSIIDTLQRMFPDFHPYEDQFDSVVPHVCLSEHGSFSDRRSLARRVGGFLPISSRASHVWMMSNRIGPDEWSIAKIFYLDSTPPSLTGSTTP